MKHRLLFALIAVSTAMLQAQSLIGAWESTTTSTNGLTFKTVVIFSSNYQVSTTYDDKTGKFKSTNGGSWRLEGDLLTETVEFNSVRPEQVGTQKSFKIVLKDQTLYVEGSNQKFVRIDDGVPGALAGAWLMSARKRGDTMQSRATHLPRKTMKILSGTRFQWIAYNTDTKEFLGTGGGTYSTQDGTYIEDIEFFSKDISRVGARLTFSYDFKNTDWHHSGLSSKGTPIYEVWSLRK